MHCTKVYFMIMINILMKLMPFRDSLQTSTKPAYVNT